jgi:hypothetical protein
MLKDVLKDRFTAKWWKTDPVEQSKLDAVLQAAYLAPVKNGKYDHEIMVLTDSPEGRAIKEFLYFDNTWCGDGIRKKPGFVGIKRFNGQVMAPVVLLWSATIPSSTKSILNETEKTRIRDNCLLQAGFAMCAAEEQGLRTGINSTQSGIDIARHLGIAGKECILSLGLGYADIEPSKRAEKPVFEGAVSIATHPNDRPKAFPNAYSLLVNNRTFIQKEANRHVAHQRYIGNPAFFDINGKAFEYLTDRCSRDIGFVINALADGLQNNNDSGLLTTVSEYWKAQKIQVRNNIEDEVHKFIRELITQYILTNGTYPARQTEVIQFRDFNKPAEAQSIVHTDSMYQTFIDGLNGQGVLNQIGFDISNINPTVKTNVTRKFKPAIENMIKYI